MFEDFIFFTKLYLDNNSNMEDYKICIKVFEKFCKIYRYKPISVEMFNFFFTTWLPKIYGKAEQWQAQNMLSAVIDFCHDYDCHQKTYFEDILYNLPCCVELDLRRILKLKSAILNATNSAYISFVPYIFNFTKKTAPPQKPIDTSTGYFRMSEIFTNNSIVLHKITGYNSYIRVGVDKNIIKLLRKDDIIHLKLLKFEPKKSWSISEIYSCHTSYATDLKGIALKESI